MLIGITIAIVMFLAGSLGTFVIMKSTYDGYGGDADSNLGVNRQPLFTNYSVTVLGISQQASGISDALSSCTANITFVDNLDGLTSVQSTQIILIDGAWLKDQNTTHVGDTIERFFINSTAIAVIDGPSDVLMTILQSKNVDGGFERSSSESYAMCYIPALKGSSCFSLGKGNLNENIIILYNWCVSQKARL